MEEVTSKLKIKLPKGNDTFNRQAYTNNLEAIEENAASQEQINEPFYLKRVIYDNRDNRLELTFGKGRARFLDSLVSKTDESIYKINGPAANTVYFIYLQEDGSYIHNTNGREMSGAILIWKVITGTTVDEVEWEDLRGQLLGAAARKVQDNLNYHSNSSAPHTGHETKQGAQNKANTAETNAKKYADSIKPTKVSQLTNDKAYITKSGAPVQSINGKTGSVTLTSTDVGAETPAGAQEKANKAEANAKEYAESHAKSYTDKEVAKTNKKLDTHVVDYNKFKDEMTKPEYSYTEKTAQSLIDLPNATNGQISGVNIEGRTVTNLLGSDGDFGIDKYDGDIAKGWSVYGATECSISNNIQKIHGVNGYGAFVSRKPESEHQLEDGKYIFIIDLRAEEVVDISIGRAKDQYNCNIDWSSKKNITVTTTFKRFIYKGEITSDLSYCGRGFGIMLGNTNYPALYLRKAMIIRVTDAEYSLSEEELLQRYPYHNGTKSTFSNGQLRLVSKGKNLIPNYNDPLFNQGKGTIAYANKWINGKLEVRNGSNNHEGRGIKINVIPNKKYKFTFSCQSSSKGRCRLYISKDSTSDELGKFSKNTGRHTYEFTPITEHVWIVFVHEGKSSQDNPVYFYDMILSELSTDYTPYQFDTKYIELPDEFDGLHSLPNGTKDEIRMFDVRDGKVEFLSKWELRKKVSDRISLNSYIGIQLSTSETNVDLVIIPKTRLINVLSASDRYGERFKITGFSPLNGAKINLVSSIGLSYENPTNFALIVEKNKYANQTEALNDLLSKGTELIYQLAEPKTYELDIPAISCFENGSVEVSNWSRVNLKAEDFNNLYTGYSNLDIVFIKKLPNQCDFEANNKIENVVKIDGWVETAFADDVNNVGKFYTSAGNEIGLLVEKNKYSNIEEAQLDFLGKIVEYQTDNLVLPAIQFAYPKNTNAELQAMNRAIKQNADILDMQRLMLGSLEDSAIIEMGENANGSYVRWANGLQMCYWTCEDATTGMYKSVKQEITFYRTDARTWNYPASFIEIPMIAVSTKIYNAEHINAGVITRVIHQHYAEVQSWNVSAQATIVLQCQAIGRWK